MGDNYAIIIVAAGKGLRFGSNTPKQYLVLDNKPILVFTIERFLDFFPNIQCILVVSKDKLSETRELLVKHQLGANVQLTVGGDTRFESVKNGLQQVGKNRTVVGIHDAVRPLVSKEVAKSVFETAEKKGSAIPTLPLQDSIREIFGNKSRSVRRENYKIVQTPQCFQTRLIQKAYRQSYSSQFTDDASVFEQAGFDIHLTKGNKENIKITTPEDLEVVRLFLEIL